MNPHIDPSVAEIERAAFQLRRLWAKPHLLQRLRERCGSGERPIQLSSLLVIHAIAGQDAGQGDVTVGAVADFLDIDPSTASRLVGHATDAGFVSRTSSPVDARRAHLRLTEAGDRVRALTDELRRRFIAQLVADWPEEDRRMFAHLLGRFAEAAANFPTDTAAMKAVGLEVEAARRHDE
ncbi:MarR family winged helix-turn-helix transcriptional regulator [Actinoallomurus acaciae]|uniref:MarR family winged helix-turn-helix transcriptional regulator n=1 Tax=Actinoallomurus acaciae TaxID=502577 RepID=A0ABV5YX09_9ACTN